MNRKKLMNLVMVLLIGAVIAGGILYAGNLRGWFGGNTEEMSARVSGVSGSVSVERGGVGFSMNGDSFLRDGDILETRSGSSAVISGSGNTLYLSEDTEIVVTDASADCLSIEIVRGQVFIEVGDHSSFGKVAVEDCGIVSAGTVYTVDVQTGSWSIYVYEGSVEAMGKTVGAGETLNVVGGSTGKTVLLPESLDPFNIARVRDACGRYDVCFSEETLDAVVAAREEEKRLALEEQAAHDAMILAQGGTVAVATTTTTSSPVPGGSPAAANLHTCTIQIRCDTILDNMDKLTPGKNAYVPASGVILATSSVQFVEGETVFEVLQRACSYAGIQLEYSWTPMYGSYYIEGINNLYEFDCGAESGWMYKVNGWFPNYGCSSYTLKDGDVIVWCYTCNGLGADVGGSVY